jgi:hypothetical protein
MDKALDFVGNPVWLQIHLVWLARVLTFDSLIKCPFSNEAAKRGAPRFSDSVQNSVADPAPGVIKGLIKMRFLTKWPYVNGMSMF